ncbi:Putative integral membrane protein DUF46 [Variovorax sp. HW608]|uniref:CDP-archaeol synthase n=1 Tax=Variovorax sp. HW608 TaxID=1034889 RepID=UPI00081FEEC1|nr:CDP-archaeol synthase [Variovorax sp. HW608]SCK27769.1 Putative integral membrane protein DUF46 [Variovorax sp. HW608]
MDVFWLGVRLLLLLTAANGAPILFKSMLGEYWCTPIDFGHPFFDGRPWLGPSKTWRGLAAAVTAAAVVAPVLGFPPDVGALFGFLAMIGDVLSSFVKRRLDVAPSGQAFGIDQVPESLLPLLVMQHALAIPWPVIGGVTLAFLLMETPVAWLFHRLGLRDRPY